MKYYAVKAGRKPGIYTTWDDCQKQVTGYSNAAFKSFKTKAEAEAFIGETIALPGDSKEKDEGLDLSVADVVAYVDGSYDAKTNRFSYGCVIFYDGKEEHFSKEVFDESLATMHNVAGEIKGAETAMRYAISKNAKSLAIYHDYEGIAKWCTGEWKANKDGTVAYRDYYRSIKDRLDVTFVKVKGHSNDKYNDMADHLAKEAIGLL